jgi:AcrR family transcriptional regulator
MEAATKERELSGDKAQRIVDAMRDSVARRGAAGSTFEHVAREAGVSRGLLHYYFGTKERLLVEVVRRDAEIRITRLDERLAKATSVDDVLDVLVASLTDMIENEPGFFLLLYELFSAGRRNPDIQREVGQLFERTRSHVAEVLDAKQREGVLKLRSSGSLRSRARQQPGACRRRRLGPVPARLRVAASIHPPSDAPHRLAPVRERGWPTSQCATE